MLSGCTGNIVLIIGIKNNINLFIIRRFNNLCKSRRYTSNGFQLLSQDHKPVNLICLISNIKRIILVKLNELNLQGALFAKTE